jgi:Cu-processing system ATP-binding protein
MIEIKELHKSYGKHRVLEGINLEIRKPGIIAVLGPNGSGKTTLIKSILGMVIPTSGLITVKGEPISKQWEYRSGISYLPQIARFPENLTVEELLKFLGGLRSGQSNLDRLINIFDLEEFLKEKIRNLSGGTKQKVNLAIGLMYETNILILDEPTTGLDPVALLRLKKLLKKEKEKGKFILISTHIMQFVEEMADEIIFLLEGNIYFRGTVTEILQRHHASNLEIAIANILQKDGIRPASGRINGESSLKDKIRQHNA